LRRYKRLNFGISSAAEVFQVTIQQVIEGIEGARYLSDDIIVFGKTQQEHDQNLKKSADQVAGQKHNIEQKEV
jgi:hypothetical protein